jgi:hypothetical protein
MGLFRGFSAPLALQVSAKPAVNRRPADMLHGDRFAMKPFMVDLMRIPLLSGEARGRRHNLLLSQALSRNAREKGPLSTHLRVKAPFCHDQVIGYIRLNERESGNGQVSCPFG